LETEVERVRTEDGDFGLELGKTDLASYRSTRC
jgi:hypothetical protein